MRHTLYFLITFVLSGLIQVSAQVDFDYAKIKHDFPDDDIYCLGKKTSLNLAIKNDKLQMQSHIELQLLYLTEQAKWNSAKSIYYYEATEDVNNINAASWVPDDHAKYNKIKVDKIYSLKPGKNDIFYDDMKEYTFEYADLKPGAYSTLSYDETYKDVHFLDPFYFSLYIPVRNSEFNVTFPSDVHPHYLLKGDTTKIKFSSHQKGNLTTWTWQASDLDKYREEENGTDLRYFAPHLIFYIESFTTKDKNIKVLDNVTSLHKWYRTHIGALDSLISDPILKSVSDSLTRGMTDTTAMIKAIYYWVQENIRYIAFEYGLGGFVPRTASKIYSRRYGDCKDKSCLLHALLKEKGIKSYFTWVGTRDIPYTYNELPTPAVDNHMIVSLFYAGQWMFLDGTSRKLNLGSPSGFIQGKEVLISISTDSFKVMKVPVVEMEKNFVHEDISLEIKGDNLLGKSEVNFGGYLKQNIINHLSAEETNNREEKIKDLFRYGNNKCKVDSLHYTGLQGYTDSLIFMFNFLIPAYVRAPEKNLLVNMNLKKPFQDENIELDKRKTDLEEEFCYNSILTARLKIPAGYIVLKLPKNTEYLGDHFGYEISYKKEEGNVVMRRVMTINELRIRKDEFIEWNKMISSLNLDYSELVMLEKE